MRAGEPLSHMISLASGFPDANITWTLRNQTGATIQAGSVTPTALAVSAIIPILAGSNALVAPVLQGTRDLSWTYTVAGATVSGSFRYLLEGLIPFGVTPEAVRLKLGLPDANELPDEDIPLMAAYLRFENDVGAALLLPFQTGTSYDQMVIVDSIEASAALLLIPSLQVRVAQKESSGTNQFTRADVDWEKLSGALHLTAAAGQALVNPALDPTAFSDVSLLQLVTPSNDIFPG